jgi:hypothetical protein
MRRRLEEEERDLRGKYRTIPSDRIGTGDKKGI